MGLISWLESHDKLAGWAQLAGAMLALAVTYLTVFIPIWHRKGQLQKSAARLLQNGYEVLESYHRTTPQIVPDSLTLRGAALSVSGVVEEIDRFPVYELDDQGSRSTARHLLALKGQLVGCHLILQHYAEAVQGRTASLEERDLIVEFLGDRLEFVRKMLAGEPLERPVWPTSDAA